MCQLCELSPTQLRTNNFIINILNLFLLKSEEMPNAQRVLLNISALESLAIDSVRLSKTLHLNLDEIETNVQLNNDHKR